MKCMLIKIITMHNGMNAGFTLPVLFESSFKYYSALEDGCLSHEQIGKMVVWVKSGYFYCVEVPLRYTFLYIHLPQPVLGMVEQKYM